MKYKGLPEKQGLYDPRNEHDACGIGFVANIKNKKSHEIIQQGLEILANLTHRGAVGADPRAGDGAGILIQMPDAFLRRACGEVGVELPQPGDYGVGMLFLPKEETARNECQAVVEKFIADEGQTLIGWRDVPVDNSGLGDSVIPTEPFIRQVFIGRGANCADQDAFERKLFVIRKQAELAIDKMGDAYDDFYSPSFSSRTLVYKGMLLADQVGEFYLDLNDETMVTALALVHQRFSTNTFPSWRLAHPYRMICHNGEINTVRGNINWMAARRHLMQSDMLGDDLDKLWPLIVEGQSDSATFDNGLELLVQGGYSLAHAMMMLIPEAWTGNPLMDEQRRAFYEYHAALMEPWDGPAAVAFTDGRQIGATLDRNGLRPARYVITNDDMVVMGSEVGVLTVPEEKIIKKWRLQPGKMLLIDLEQGRIIDDDDIKAELSSAHPYQEWLDRTQIVLEELPGVGAGTPPPNRPSLLDRQQAFGYTQEDLKFLMAPMAATGQEAVGSMGTDIPIAALSSRPKLLYSYFKQVFAQVTNPAIDPIREELVMSLLSLIGPRPNLLGINNTSPQKRLEVRQPVLTNKALEKIRSIGEIADNAFRTITLDMTYPSTEGETGMQPALDALCRDAENACQGGYNIIILSDRAIGEERIAIPALLATAAVHHHLVRTGLRTAVGLVVETGEAREVHHFCTLAGYGAEAVNPYLAFETLSDMRADLPEDIGEKELSKRYIKAVDKGILKVMSKMGISTYQSYCGAQIFDAVGLSSGFVDRYFTGTATTIEGVDLAEVARETVVAPPPGLRRVADPSRRPGCRRRVRLPDPRRGTLLDARDGGQFAARRARQRPRPLRGFRAAGERPVQKDDDHPRADGDHTGRQADTVGRGRAGERDRQAVLDRRHVVRVDLARSAFDAGHRHEPDRRQVEHGRRRRGTRPLRDDAQRRFHALGHQAGGVRAVRRDHRVSRQLGHDADQDRAGRQARRGRPAAGSQGRRGDRQGAALDARRRVDLAAAASRHLLDRGSCAAYLRSQEHQSRRRRQRQAGVRGRCRHGRGRGCQSALRPCDHRRL